MTTPLDVCALDDAIVKGALRQPKQLPHAHLRIPHKLEDAIVFVTADSYDVEFADAARRVLVDSWASRTATRWEIERGLGLTGDTGTEKSAA